MTFLTTFCARLAAAKLPRRKSVGFGRDDCGAYAVEFAIVFPVLLVMIFGAVEIGRVFYEKDRLHRLTADGTRLLLIDPALDNDTLKTRVETLATTAFGDPSQVTVTVTDETKAGVAFKNLTVQRPHTVAAKIAGIGAVNLNAKSRVLAPSVWYTPPTPIE